MSTDRPKVAQSKAKRAVETKPQVNWIDPLNKIALKAAFKARAPQVAFRNGRIYLIKYDQTADGVDCAFVSPQSATQHENRHAPCGWFSLDKYAKEL